MGLNSSFEANKKVESVTRLASAPDPVATRAGGGRPPDGAPRARHAPHDLPAADHVAAPVAPGAPGPGHTAAGTVILLLYYRTNM